jgi:hypothetical protein
MTTPKSVLTLALSCVKVNLTAKISLRHAKALHRESFRQNITVISEIAGSIPFGWYLRSLTMGETCE